MKTVLKIPGGTSMLAMAIVLSAGQVVSAEMQNARAIVKASAQATISVSLTAPVKTLSFKVGQAFTKDQVIVAFDCARYRAELRARQAIYSARREEVTNNDQLLRYGAMGASEVSISKSRMLEARALVEVQEAMVQQCIIRAPYDGRVVAQLINENETPGPNQPLIKIVGTSKTELELIVPSRWLVWLEEGVRFSFRVDETGETLDAKILRLGAVVDAVSQTIKVTGEFSSNQKKSVLPGMSGTATFASSGS